MALGGSDVEKVISPSASQDRQLVRYSISQLLVVGNSVPQLISQSISYSVSQLLTSSVNQLVNEISQSMRQLVS